MIDLLPCLDVYLRGVQVHSFFLGYTLVDEDLHVFNPKIPEATGCHLFPLIKFRYIGEDCAIVEEEDRINTLFSEALLHRFEGFRCAQGILHEKFPPVIKCRKDGDCRCDVTAEDFCGSCQDVFLVGCQFI